MTFAELPMFHYKMIVCDPPWSFQNFSAKGHGKSAHAHYACMDLDAIKALPVASIAAPDSFVWLWATNPMLDRAFEVLRAWNCRFVTAGHWSKKSATGKQAFGTGYVLRCCGEPFLVGAFGKPKAEARNIRSVIEGPIRGHSRKPDEAFTAAELMISGPRIELFSRQRRPGWDTWGNEQDKFEATT